MAGAIIYNFNYVRAFNYIDKGSDCLIILSRVLFMAVGIFIGATALTASFGISQILNTYAPDSEKNSPFECGFEAFEDARMKFDIRYITAAILFIILIWKLHFFPWAVVLDDIGTTGFWAMMIFLGILVVGFIYEWKKGA